MHNKTVNVISLVFLVLLTFGLFSATSAAQKSDTSACQTDGLLCMPNIVKIETFYDSAKVYLEDCGDLCKDLFVTFSKDPTSSPSEIRLTPIHDSNSDLLVANISPLEANSTYYFRARCADEKNCAQNSKPLQVQTSVCNLAFYASSNNIKTLSCGAALTSKSNDIQNSISWSMHLTSAAQYSKPVLLVSIASLLIIFLLKNDNCHKFQKRSRSLFRQS